MSPVRLSPVALTQIHCRAANKPTILLQHPPREGRKHGDLLQDCAQLVSRTRRQRPRMPAHKTVLNEGLQAASEADIITLRMLEGGSWTERGRRQGHALL